MSILTPRSADRFTLKAFVEACLVVEEGVAGIRDVDMGMMMGAGMVPGPFARADLRGLDDVLEALERPRTTWGEHFEPPLILRRMVAQGRLGAKSGPGLLPLSRSRRPATSRRRSSSTAAATSRSCGWTTRPPTRSRPHVIEALERAWGEVEGSARAMVVASPNPALFCAGADIRAFTKMDEPRAAASCWTARTGCSARSSARG